MQLKPEPFIRPFFDPSSHFVSISFVSACSLIDWLTKYRLWDFPAAADRPGICCYEGESLSVLCQINPVQSLPSHFTQTVTTAVALSTITTFHARLLYILTQQRRISPYTSVYGPLFHYTTTLSSTGAMCLGVRVQHSCRCITSAGM